MYSDKIDAIIKVIAWVWPDEWVKRSLTLMVGPYVYDGILYSDWAHLSIVDTSWMLPSVNLSPSVSAFSQLTMRRGWGHQERLYGIALSDIADEAAMQKEYDYWFLKILYSKATDTQYVNVLHNWINRHAECVYKDMEPYLPQFKALVRDTLESRLDSLR